MSRKKPIAAVAVPLILVLAITGLVSVAPVEAADFSSLFASQWFDWSDYRAKAAARVFFARFSGGGLDINNEHFDLKKDYGFTDDSEPFREFYGEVYIDRLGFRFYLSDDTTFRGRVGDSYSPPTVGRVSELDTSTGSLGFDLDLVRYPFLRLGINANVLFGDVKVQDRRQELSDNWKQYSFASGYTCGIHGKAIPGRVRGVPVTLEGRLQLPIPLRIDNKETKVTELEIFGGVQPAIWNMSSYGLSTFSVGLAGGYRFVNLDAQTVTSHADVTLKARWQGAFIEMSINF